MIAGNMNDCNDELGIIEMYDPRDRDAKWKSIGNLNSYISNNQNEIIQRIWSF